MLPSPQVLQKRNAQECNEPLKSYLFLWVRNCKPPEASFLCVSSIFKRRQGVTSCLSVFHSGQCNCIRNGAERPLEPPQPDSLVCVCHCSLLDNMQRFGLVRFASPRTASFCIGRVRFGSFRFGSVQVGSGRFGSVRLGSVRLGSARVGAVRVASRRIVSVRFGSLSAPSGCLWFPLLPCVSLRSPPILLPFGSLPLGSCLKRSLLSLASERVTG